MIKPRYFVNYTVLGRDYQAGPYDLAEANERHADIKGYVGVTACWVGSERIERWTLTSAGWAA